MHIFFEDKNTQIGNPLTYLNNQLHIFTIHQGICSHIKHERETTNLIVSLSTIAFTVVFAERQATVIAANSTLTAPECRISVTGCFKPDILQSI